MKRWMILFVSLVLSIPITAAAQEGVDVDADAVRRMGDVVQKVGDGFNGEDPIDQFVAAAATPADDNHKWFLSVLSTRACLPCARLKQRWLAAGQRAVAGQPLDAGDEWLVALANPADASKSWSHYNVYDVDNPAQSRRFRDLKVDEYPTILLQPPLSGSYGDPTTVVYQAVYRGDPKALADGIAAAVKAYLAKAQPKRSGFGQLPPLLEAGQPARPLPWQPTPRNPAPADPSPATPSNPLPIFPTVPPVAPAPMPVAPAAPDDTPHAKSQSEIVIVADGDGAEDLLADSRIHRAVEEIRRTAGDGDKLRTRFIDFRDALTHSLPVDRTELPVVFHVDKGKIATKLSTKALGVFHGFFSSLWDSITAPFIRAWHLVQLTAVIVVVLVLGYYGLKAYRMLHPASVTVSLAAEAIKLEQVVEAAIRKRFNQPTDPTPPAG